MGNAAGCGNGEDNEHMNEGAYQDRVRGNNYSRAYKGNKDDPRSNPYRDSEYKKNDQEKLKNQYMRPMPSSSIYDRYDPYNIDKAQNLQDSANFYPRSHLTSTIPFEKVDRTAEKQALGNDKSERRMLREANYQSVDHTPTIPVKRTNKMYRYNQDALLTLAKYPNYRLSLPADMNFKKDNQGTDYKLQLKTAEKGNLEGSMIKPTTSHIESDRKRAPADIEDRNRFTDDETGKKLF